MLRFVAVPVRVVFSALFVVVRGCLRPVELKGERRRVEFLAQNFASSFASWSLRRLQKKRLLSTRDYLIRDLDNNAYKCYSRQKRNENKVGNEMKERKEVSKKCLR